MTQLSKLPLRKEIEERMFEVFKDSIGMVTTRSQVERLIDDLLSPTERVMLAKRLSIALLLSRKYDQRSISKILKVGLNTINKVSRSLKTGSGYKMICENILTQEKFKEFLQKIDDFFADVFPPRHRNWSAWRRERREEKMRKQKPF